MYTLLAVLAILLSVLLPPSMQDVPPHPTSMRLVTLFGEEWSWPQGDPEGKFTLDVWVDVSLPEDAACRAALEAGDAYIQGHYDYLLCVDFPTSQEMQPIWAFLSQEEVFNDSISQP